MFPSNRWIFRSLHIRLLLGLLLLALLFAAHFAPIAHGQPVIADGLTTQQVHQGEGIVFLPLLTSASAGRPQLVAQRTARQRARQTGNASGLSIHAHKNTKRVRPLGPNPL